MQRLLRIACIAYVVLLTLLLLTVNPVRLLGFHGGLPRFLQALMPSAHLLSFLVLAVLMLSARWPLPRWSVVLILAIYGTMTEVIQGFVPPRTPEWLDLFQDLGGLAVGAAICWTVAVLMAKTSWIRLISTAADLLRLAKNTSP
jgi:VanZ family protein